MNPDEIKSACGQFATALCFFLTGAGLITAAQSSEIVKDVGLIAGAIGVAAPAVAGLVSVASSIWRHWNQKKVPEKAVAVMPSTAVAATPGAIVNVAGKVVGLLLVGFLVLHVSAAFAQGSKTAVPLPTPAPGIPCDPLHLIPGCVGGSSTPVTQQVNTNLSALWTKIVSAKQADLQYALALAQNVNSPGSNLRATCYQALIKANQQANGTTLKNPDGTPMTAPSPDVISQFEQAAELVDNLQATAPVMSACAAAANAIGQSTTQFLTTALAAVAVKVAAPLP